MTGRTNLKTWIVMSVFVLGMGCTAASGRTIYVDNVGSADFNNIQAAINDANNGDTIIVADGIYTGDGNRDIDFLGKAITLRSDSGPENCIIDCNATETDRHRGFVFRTGENADSAIIGLTITNGYAPLVGVMDLLPPWGWTYWSIGGAILCSDSSPAIRNCTIRGNKAGGHDTYYDGGGGIACYWESDPTITNCTFSGNSTSNHGGGIACFGFMSISSPSLANCTFMVNSAQSGGGIHNWSSSPILTNCTFSGNVAQDTGGAIANYPHNNVTLTNCTFGGNKAPNGNTISCDSHSGYWSNLQLTNCIIWDGGSEIWNNDNSVITITYSDVQSGWLGTGNINADPCFSDPCNGDYHLKSQAGRWDANEGRWTKDEVTSPCIDAGDPTSPIGLEPFPNGGRINIGAYGGTAQASKSYFGQPPCEIIVAGDINGDCIVDFKDFALMALHWLRDENP